MASSTSGRAHRPDATPTIPPAGLGGLGNRFVELFSRKLSRRAFAAETVKLITEAVKVKAVAVLGFDRRRDRLFLLADHGLAPAARAALGGGADCAWDIPMRGLRNRRISVIEAAHQNPFVPRPLVALSPAGLCVASVPLYYDTDPVGVVLLFSVGSRAFPDTHLQTLSLALRVCARGLRDMSAHGARAAKLGRREIAKEGEAAPPPAGEPPEIGAVSEERLATQPVPEAPPPVAQPAAADVSARVQRLEAELRRAQEELERSLKSVRTLTASNAALMRERDGYAEQLAEAERARGAEAAELRAQVAALEERLLAVDAERARNHRLGESRHASATQTITRLESEKETLGERVATSEAATAELRTRLSAERAERERLAAQVELLNGDVHAGQESLQRTQARFSQEHAALEADRDAWKEQAAVLRTQLAERTEALTAVDRSLRSTVVGRDAAASQLQAAREEIDRLTALTEELGQRAGQLEAAHANAAAQNTTLQRALDDERRNSQDAENALRSDLAAACQESERRAADATALRDELAQRAQMLADREAQLAALRQEQAAARQAETQWQQTDASQRTELAALTARLDEAASEQRQLLDERAALRASLAEARQQGTQADVLHAAALGQIHAEAAELRRQVETLQADRGTLGERLERAIEEGRALTLRLAETQRRSGELSELLRERDAAAESLAAEREDLATQVATLSGQLQAAQEAVERTRAASARERSTIERERDESKEQVALAREELSLRAERLTTIEHDLGATTVARDNALTELQTTRETLDQLAGQTDQLRQTVAHLEAEHAAQQTELDTLRTLLEDERADRARVERALRTDLGAARSEAERLSLAMGARQDEIAEQGRALAERDERLTRLRAEVEALRHQSADRGVLAHQAAELGRKVVELEQALAQARGDAAHAARERDAVAERLDAARRREAESVTAADRERATLQETVQQLTDERARLEAAGSAQQSAIEELQAALAEVQSERARATQESHETARELAAVRGQLDTVGDQLRERERGLEAAVTGRAHLAEQLAAVTEQLQLSHAALESAQAAFAEERTAIEADRDRWKVQTSDARGEIQQLSELRGTLQDALEEITGERNTLADQSSALRQTLEDERAESRRVAETLQNDAAGVRAETATLRAALVERDEQMAALREHVAIAKRAETEWQRERAAARHEAATLTARLQDSATECQQLRDGRAAVEHQLALVTAAQGEEQKTLADGLQAAREQVTRLEQERSHLMATLAEARQEVSQVEAARDAVVAQATGETAELRQQLETLTETNSTLGARLEKTEHALADHVEQLGQERERAVGYARQSARLEELLGTADAERVSIDTELAQTREVLAATTARLEETGAAAQQLRDERTVWERELAAREASSGEHEQALTQQLAVTQAQLAQIDEDRNALQAALAEARERIDEMEAAHTAARQRFEADGGQLAEQVQTLTVAHDALGERLRQAEEMHTAAAEQSASERARAAALAEQCTQLEDSLVATQARATSLDEQVTHARAEIAALRQQSEDRGVLAHQASELGSRVVELEQQLAAERGAVATADRARVVLAEELEAARNVQCELEEGAERQQGLLRETAERLAQEQRRLEAETARRVAEAEAHRGALAAQQTELEHLRATQAQLHEDGQDALRRVGELQRQTEELTAVLHQREAAIETATAERKRLAGQVAKLAGQLRTAQDAFESLQGRTALERASAEADRDAAKAEATAARDEREQLAQQAEDWKRSVTQLEAARGAAAAESTALRRALDDARASHRHTEGTLRADLAAVQAEVERLSSDAVAHRAELAARDEALAALRQQHELAQQTEAQSQQTVAALRAELDALRGQLAQGADEGRQASAAREVVERQLALAMAARAQDERALEAARGQISRLDQDRSTLQRALEEMREQAEQTETDHERALGQLRADAAEIRQQVAALTDARRSLDERLERADRAGAANAERAEDEHQRAEGLAAQCAQTEQALAAAETRRTALNHDLAKARAEIDALRQQSADRGALAHQASELGGRIAELEQQLAAQRGDLVRAERQRAALAEEMAAVGQQHEQAVVEAERGQTNLRQALARMTEERDQLAADQTRRVTEVEAQRAELAELRTVVEQFQREREQAQSEQTDVAQRVADTHRRMEELSGLLQERDALIQAATTERIRLEAAVRTAETRVAGLETERDELLRQVNEAANRFQQDRAASREGETIARDLAAQTQSQERHAPPSQEATEPDGGEPPTALYQGPLVIERSAPLGAVLEGAPEPLDAADEGKPARSAKAVVPSGDLILLDEGALRDDACAALKGAGFQVSTFPPTEAGADELARRKVKCIMLNLGSGPGAWHTLRVLRERVATRSVPILAYIMKKDAAAGFCFGRADFAIWPIDATRMIERLHRLRPKIRRLLALSADVDGMNKMREPLVQARISTSIVLDGKQALDFAAMVDPEAAMLHLSPTCPTATRALLGLRTSEATCDLPLLLLLDKIGGGREEQFFAAATTQLLTKAAFQFVNLPEEIARAIA